MYVILCRASREDAARRAAAAGLGWPLLDSTTSSGRKRVITEEQHQQMKLVPAEGGTGRLQNFHDTQYFVEDASEGSTDPLLYPHCPTPTPTSHHTEYGRETEGWRWCHTAHLWLRGPLGSEHKQTFLASSSTSSWRTSSVVPELSNFISRSFWTWEDITNFLCPKCSSRILHVAPLRGRPSMHLLVSPWRSDLRYVSLLTSGNSELSTADLNASQKDIQFSISSKNLGRLKETSHLHCQTWQHTELQSDQRFTEFSKHINHKVLPALPSLCPPSWHHY